MRYFDVHLHIPHPNQAGLDALLRHVEDETNLIGGLLILNTVEEVEFVYGHLHDIPPHLVPVPYFARDSELPPELTRTGWFKIHPPLSRIDRSQIAEVRDAVLNTDPRPCGLIVHCYPWGVDLKYEVSLELVIELARAAPELPILAAHGGGYESWAYRAHTGSLKNVLYDFSVSMAYFRGSDLLRPFQVYVQSRPHRLLFGSDWPHAECREQLDECARLAQEVDINESELEAIMLANSRRYWPEFINEESASSD